MPTSNAPIEFPEEFVDKVHAYLKHNQQRYGGKYQNYFITTPPKKTSVFLGPHQNKPHTFQSLCCIAGKMCGLLSLTYSNHTLPVLLDAVKVAYGECSTDDQSTISQLFGNKTKEHISEDDLLEIGLYNKIDSHPISPGEFLLRHQNLKTIYAGEHQRMNRQDDSLPDHIHHWIIIEKSTPEFDPEILFQSELCTKKYEIKTAKSNDYGKIWLITESKKELISEPASENAGLYFLSQLEKTLRVYYDNRDNLFYKTFGKKSAASIKLYNALFDIIINDGENTSEKINAILIILNNELAQIQKLSPNEQLKTRRLINLLAEAGFMCPDILRAAEHQPSALAQSDPIETQDVHPAMHG